MDRHPSSKKIYTPNHRLREARELLGLGHKDVAERIDVSDPHTVGGWERGEHVPSPHYRQKLCEFFGKNAEELGLIRAKSGENEPPMQEQSVPPIRKLPLLLGTFIGREQDRTAVCELLSNTDIRLVSLTGPGGVGKTCLSVEVAGRMDEHFPDGICFVALSAVTDPMLVLSTIAQELGLHESGTQSILARLQQELHDKAFLLVLDNFEQVVKAAPDVEQLLAECPQLKVLVTSREVLHLRAEREYELLPMAVPDLEQLLMAEKLMQYDAVALFIKRAQARHSAFQLTAQNTYAIVEICRHLEGLPLAIELAAARIKVLTPQKLLERLSQDLHLLRSDIQTQPERHQTLSKAIQWSYDLLSEQEQWVFRQFSLFPGGCTLETAEALFSRGQTLDILDIITSLIDKSLMRQREDEEGSPRFVMLGMVREYGEQCLQEAGEKEESRQAQALYYHTLLKRAKAHLSGEAQAAWLVILRQEIKNLRVILAWLIQQRMTEEALHFCEVFGKFCGLHGYWSEERYWLRTTLNLPPDTEAVAIRAKVLRRAGHLAYRRRDLAEALALLEESVTLSRVVGDTYNLAGALSTLGWVCYRQKDDVSASQFLDESVKAAREAGDKWSIANVLESRARLLYLHGQTNEAHQLLNESLTIARELGYKETLVRILTALVSIEIEQGNITLATTLAHENYALAQELGMSPVIALALGNLGEVAQALGDYTQASDYFERRISYAQDLYDTSAIAVSQLHLSEIALAQGSPEQAMIFVEDSLRIFRAKNDNPNIAIAFSVLGDINRTQQKFGESISHYKDSFLFSKELNYKRGVGRSLIGLIKFALERQQYKRAAHLFGLMSIHCEPQRDLHLAQHDYYKQAIEQTRAHLGEQIFMAAWSQGQLMSIEETLISASSVN